MSRGYPRASRQALKDSHMATTRQLVQASCRDGCWAKTVASASSYADPAPPQDATTATGPSYLAPPY